MTRATEHIRVSEDTKERLENLGSSGDSFDDCIRRLLPESDVQ